MPELPEVQTVVAHLARQITGKVFLSCQIKAARMVSRGFAAQINNKKILEVSRRAKMIIIKLSGDKYLLIHLKMTGQLIYVSASGKVAGGGHPINAKDFSLRQVNKFTRVVLNFTDSSRLLFHDVRRFGWLKIVNIKQFEKIIGAYGLEPLSKEFNLQKFREILQRRLQAKIKQLLMTQELIAGIGNIYADESLFAAKILPVRLAKTLKPAEVKALHSAIKKILHLAVAVGGTSVNTFVHPTGERGQMAEKLKVYQRGGKKCLRCGAILHKIKLGGRGTVFCEKCQK
ncbi:MAG: bifunctional DNA-formamidopyrimidine glycosylase/DNA-(apurinic or apyrimidinic site) lyase [Candidatus Komeilibacteria bacterium]|nr:bifunctional DNA-formamidopyrimidine glycosylase/DNA-(apurinic or apyrimidinic site) lyase [Candidatus Komeilibacteria bacterium]